MIHLLENVSAVADCGDFFCPGFAVKVLPWQQRNNSCAVIQQTLSRAKIAALLKSFNFQ